MLKAANPQPWWEKTNRKTLEERVRAVQNVNDPTIISDDVQRWSTVALWALLAFTTFLSFFSYFKFFEKSFGIYAAGVMAGLLAMVIEFGKNWGTLKVLRQPFFNGWNMIKSEVHHTIMWGGLLLLSIVTFSASVYNSTHGAAQLSLLLGYEAHTETFKPETSQIDGQIAATQKSMADNRSIKWKGTVTYQAQRAIQKESGALDKLQAQRAAQVEQQRADYEGRQAIFNEQNKFSSNSLLAVGGWVELLQLILMFVRVSAERSLDQTASQRRAVPSETMINTPKFPHQNGAPVTNAAQIGYYWNNYGQPNALPRDSVSQPAPPVSQPSTSNLVIGCDAVLKNCEKAIRTDLPNFFRKDANPASVATRIYCALETAHNIINKEGFVPTRLGGTRLYQYLVDVVMPTLEARGYPYENSRAFISRLLQVIPQPAEY